MNSFRVRLTFIMISLFGLSILGAGLFMAQSFRENHLDTLQANMVREMKLIVSSMAWETGTPEMLYDYYTNEALKVKQITGERVTFIRGDGVVLGDSDHDPRDMMNHALRNEVVEAKENGVGRDIRKSETTNDNLMYVAIPIDPSSASSGVIRLAMGLEEVEGSVRELWYTLFIVLLLLFIASAVASYHIAKGLTRPLEQMSIVARRIKNMDYQARVNIDKSDEIGELGQSINAMADSLQEQMERIHRDENKLESVLNNMINGIVMIDRDGFVVLMNSRAEEVLGFSSTALVGRHFTEAKQQYELLQIIQEGLDTRKDLKEEITFYYPEERLLELNLVAIFHGREGFGGLLLVLQDVSAIRRLERMRSEFVANVSHELKTPIAAVKGFAETLLGGAVNDPETARSFLKIIFDESERLNRLIGDILELSKVESRRIPLQFSPIEMSSFISDTVEFIAAQAHRKNIRMDMKVDQGIYVEADEDRLRQIMMNLLSNGINYTPDGGRVSISVEPIVKKAPHNDAAEGEDDDYIRIKISDTGIGIPKKDLPRIFERFYRVDKARSRSSGGTGLGLSIVKHLVELHKGTITVESTVGVGSTFIIELPVLH
ncbi:two-component system histidine kinase PnpS [Paenibacillus abyssi]|uniref:histidine kinase n=1 Tax=Paenibacillus abyssi TaxID=1340531 RepID=A0A917CTG8_9BACL|nr:ATP-binding protein [Paenibacillus abyssi]GGF98317.1 PAS domain-containing sensor histidine kinase [Paenibacillus abyssi]